MNKYSDKLLNNFKETYRRKCGKAITDDEASEKLASLANLVKVIAPDSPSGLNNEEVMEEEP